MYKVKLFCFDGKNVNGPTVAYLNDNQVNQFIRMIRETGFVGSMNKKGGEFTVWFDPGILDHHGDYEYTITISPVKEVKPMTEDQMSSFFPKFRGEEFTKEIRPGYFAYTEKSWYDDEEFDNEEDDNSESDFKMEIEAYIKRMDEEIKKH